MADSRGHARTRCRTCALTTWRLFGPIALSRIGPFHILAANAKGAGWRAEMTSRVCQQRNVNMSEFSGESSVVSGAHWGTFHADVENGKLVRTRPSGDDTHPSPMIAAITDAVNHECRVLHPMVRASWLERGAASDRTKPGTEPL